MSNITSILINILVIVLNVIACLISVLLLCLIFFHRQRFPINTPMLLICNTFISIIFVSTFLFDMYAHYLHAELNEDSMFNNSWCYLRAYFLHVSVWLLCYSYLVQAIFRFFRVIFYRRQHWQTRRFMFQLILIQWLSGFLFVLPFFLLNYFHYIPEYHYCEILLTDMKGVMITGGFTFDLPMICMGFLYGYILYYMKKTKSQSILQNRHRTNQRDLTVLRRILIQSGILTTLGLPTAGFLCEYIFTGYVDPIGYRIGWSLFTVSVAILSITSIFITSQLRELIRVTWRRNHRIQPTIMLRQ